MAQKTNKIDVNKFSVARSEGGLLALLWRKAIKENNLDKALMHLINGHVNKEISKLVKDKEDASKVTVSTLRSAVVNRVTATNMTVKTLVDLLFNVLNVKRLDITITLTHANNRTSTHTVSTDGFGEEVTEEIVDILNKEVEENNNGK